MSSRAGIVRAEVVVGANTGGTSTVQVQVQDPVSGQFVPRQITVANLIAGGADTPLLNLGTSGTQGTLNIFPPTAASGNLQFTSANNAGNTITQIVNASFGQASTLTIPDPGNAAASFVLTKGAQTISGNITFTGTNEINTLNLGASGTAGLLTIFPATAANGTFVLDATNNAGNFASTLTNSAIGQATVYSLPDPGQGTANIVLDHGAQTIAGVKTFSSIPIGTQYVVQVNLATITGLAGAVTAIHSAAFAGTVTAISASVNAAFATSNITITPSIYHAGTPTAITSGAVTITQSGSAAGTTGTSTPSAANTFAVGDMISATITGGTGTCGGVITLLVTRTA
jgi:hypothetical protein